ncbi:MAG: hypothetical protein JSS61_06610 [Verrucomicrobia bacterium]|nr:hypothetical protein [Verrucomicrobiota bacterium]
MSSSSSAIASSSYPSGSVTKSKWEYYVNMERHGLSFEGLHMPRPEDIQEAVPSILVALPQGLTFAKMMEIGKELHVPIDTKCLEWDARYDIKEDKPIEQPYCGVMTDGFIEGRHGLTYSEQNQIVKKHPFDLPSPVELLTAMVFCRCLAKKQLFFEGHSAFAATSDLPGFDPYDGHTRLLLGYNLGESPRAISVRALKSSYTGVYTHLYNVGVVGFKKI